MTVRLGNASAVKTLRDLFDGEAVEAKGFVAGCVAADQFDAAFRTVKGFSEKFNQCLIRRGVNRWRGNFDSQFLSQRFSNLILRSSWLEFHREQDVAAL